MITIAELYGRLQGDARRIERPFNVDLLQANSLLHNPAATDDEMASCLWRWCQMRQPCQFGRVAGKERRIHFCFLRESCLANWSDEEISGKVAADKRLWKQRAAFDPTRAAHSFVVVICAHRVAYAAPDTNLRAFSNRILQLTGWGENRHGAHIGNTIASDFLYLRNPSDGRYYGFRFNVDFFACAGDGRWWHDHRFPGGIAFTANSTGHMMRFRSWYNYKSTDEHWGLTQAMLTIRNAAPTRTAESADPLEQGRATWLRSLDAKGEPLIGSVACPLAKMPSLLAGKDWTRYEGILHTDHAVREEFFVDREIAPTASRPYLMDFTYLYDERQADFQEFTGGRLFSEEEIYAEIGRPEDWTHRGSDPRTLRTEEEAASVAEQLVACDQWEAPYWYSPLDLAD